MAKYTRFDPRNKKKNRQKNRQTSEHRGIDRRRMSSQDEYYDEMYEKYGLEKILDHL